MNFLKIMNLIKGLEVTEMEEEMGENQEY